MDYTTHVNWPFKRPNFWKTWGILSCLAFTLFGPFCYAAELTKSVAKNGLQEAKFPEFSFKNCCSDNILLWLCYVSIGVLPALLGVVFVLCGWQSLGRLFCSLATLSYFVYFPAFLICASSDNDHPSIYNTFLNLPFSGLSKYYTLVIIYLLWQGVVGALTFVPAFFVGVGIAALLFKNVMVAAIFIGIFVLLLITIVLITHPYIFMAMAALVGDYMRNYKDELFEKGIVDEKTFLMAGSLAE